MESSTAAPGAWSSPAAGGETTNAMEAGNGPREVVVVFSTPLPENFRVPEHPFVVPAHFQRLELSKLVNQLLHQAAAEEDSDACWQHQPFDFLVDGKLFLRTSLAEYMLSHGLTPEVNVHLQYQLAVRRLREQYLLPSSRDWIASLAALPLEALLVEASYDGCFRLHHLSPASISGATADHEPALSLKPSTSSAVVKVSLNQGPLSAAAVFASGAYLPHGCIQVLLGSKAGGYNVVHVWDEEQQQLGSGGEPLENGSETREDHFLAETDVAVHAHHANVKGESEFCEARLKNSTKRWARKGAAVNAMGCQNSEVTCVGISHDGVTAASGGGDGKVLLWDNVPDMKAAAAQQKERGEFSCHDGDSVAPAVGSVFVQGREAESRDSSSATAPASFVPRKRKRVSRKGTAPMSFSTTRAKLPKCVLASHTDRVTDLCFPTRPLCCVLYTGALDETICAWDTIVEGAPLSVWTASRPITSLSCSPVNGTVVCSAHDDGRVRLWDIRSGGGAASWVDTDGDGRRVSTGSQGGICSTRNTSSVTQEKDSSDTQPGPNMSERVERKFAATADLNLGANSRLQPRFTFGGAADKRMITHVRWCPVRGGEHMIATVSQGGTLRLRDIRAASIPLVTVEVTSRTIDGKGAPKDGGYAWGEVARHKADHNSVKKGAPVRLLSCGWLDASRIATGGSDGIVRVFTVGTTALGERP